MRKGSEGPRRPSSGSESAAFRFFVSTPTFWLCWWTIVLVHIATFAFAMLLGGVHLLLSVPAVHLNTVGVAVSISFKRLSGISYVAVAGFHLFAAFNILRASISGHGIHLRLHSARPSEPQEPEMPANSRIRRALSSLRRAYAAFWGPTGYLSIHSTAFPTLLVVREAVEVFLQSFQAWTLSYSVTSLSINSFAVAIVALNCWSMPIVDALRTKHETSRRVAHLVTDLVLDFACTIVVPACIVLRYLLMFDWATMRFPEKCVVDDVWFANAISEGKQILVTSTLDYVSSLLPLYTIYRALRLLSRLVDRSVSAPTLAAIVPVASAAKPTQLPPPAVPNPWRRRGLDVVTSLLGLWGLALVGLHVHANVAHRVENPGCRLYARTWLATNATCSVQHIHCRRLGLVGTTDEVATLLNGLERSVLTKLALLHCPALSVPDELTHFPWLNRIEVVNSTLVAWPQTAAIRDRTHPVLTAVVFRLVDAPHMPDALLHRELPRPLLAVALLGGTLAALPENLGDLWATSGVLEFDLDGNCLRSLPASLHRLGLERLSIASNAIDALPENLLETMALSCLALSGNPLTQLPTVMDASQLRTLFAERTNISTLRPWTQSWIEGRAVRTASFFGSPVCVDASSLAVATACALDWQTENVSDITARVELMYPL